jgi:hypothetical protein
MDSQIALENQSVRVASHVADRLPRDGAPTNKKKGLGRFFTPESALRTKPWCTCANRRRRRTLTWTRCSRTTASPEWALGSPTGLKGSGCSISSGLATLLSSAGLIGLGRNYRDVTANRHFPRRGWPFSASGRPLKDFWSPGARRNGMRAISNPRASGSATDRGAEIHSL